MLSENQRLPTASSLADSQSNTTISGQRPTAAAIAALVAANSLRRCERLTHATRCTWRLRKAVMTASMRDAIVPTSSL
jgi:hypothetical protein